MVANAPTSNSPQHHVEVTLAPTDYTPFSDADAPLPMPQLNIQDLRSVATDIKNTLSAAISDLRLDLQAMVGRMQKMYITGIHVYHRVYSHNQHLRDLQRHVEELDNRESKRPA